jgi:hypothetical protein
MSEPDEEFQPAYYTLRFYEEGDRTHIPVQRFESSSPFPKFAEGDSIVTIAWPLKQEGVDAVVVRTRHCVRSTAGQLHIEQDVYCHFDKPLPSLTGSP